jgi:hypothetical protein
MRVSNASRSRNENTHPRKGGERHVRDSHEVARVKVTGVDRKSLKTLLNFRSDKNDEWVSMGDARTSVGNHQMSHTTHSSPRQAVLTNDEEKTTTATNILNNMSNFNDDALTQTESLTLDKKVDSKHNYIQT